MRAAIFVSFFIFFIFQRPFAQSPDDPVAQVDTIAKTVNILPDSTYDTKLTIEKIFVTGNEKTRESIIFRELDINRGDVISKNELHKVLERNQQKIYNTNLFNSVKLHLIYLSPTLVDVMIEVSERWYYFPVPIFELADRNFNDWWQNHHRDLSRTQYGFKFYHYNSRGRNEKAVIIAQFGYSKQFQFLYTFPYLNKAQKTGLRISVTYNQHKNLAYNTINHKLVFFNSENLLKETFKAGFTLSRRRSFYNYHFLSMYYNYRHINDTIADLNPNYYLRGRTGLRFLQLNYGFKRDYRDVAAYPLNGYLFTFEADKSGLGLFDDLDQFYLEANFYKYFNLGKDYYLSTGVIGHTTHPSAQPFNSSASLGYQQKFIRGYELYVIDGRSYFLNKITLKKLLFSGQQNASALMPLEQFQIIPYRFYLKSFFDCGIIHNPFKDPLNSKLTNTLIYGGGIGLDFVTLYDVVCRTEFSINSLGEKGFFLHFKSEL